MLQNVLILSHYLIPLFQYESATMNKLRCMQNLIISYCHLQVELGIEELSFSNHCSKSVSVIQAFWLAFYTIGLFFTPLKHRGLADLPTM